MKKVNLYESGTVTLTQSQSLYYLYRKKGYGVRETARICGVSAATVSRVLKTVDRKLKEGDQNEQT